MTALTSATSRLGFFSFPPKAYKKNLISWVCEPGISIKRRIVVNGVFAIVCDSRLAAVMERVTFCWLPKRKAGGVERGPTPQAVWDPAEPGVKGAGEE